MSLIIEAFRVLVLTLQNKALLLPLPLRAALHHAALAAACSRPEGSFPLEADVFAKKSGPNRTRRKHLIKIPIYYRRMTSDKIGSRCDLILFPSSSFKEKLTLRRAIFFPPLKGCEVGAVLYLGECVWNFAVSFAFALGTGWIKKLPPPPPQYLSGAELVCAGSICPLTTQNADGNAKTFGLVLNVLRQHSAAAARE